LIFYVRQRSARASHEAVRLYSEALMVGHVCRVCADTLQRGTDTPDFSTVVSDVMKLHDECEEIEADLHDSFNAFCFTCRRITMSVPGEVTHSEQVCYLRAQVNWFKQLCACGLSMNDIPRHSSDGLDSEIVDAATYEWTDADEIDDISAALDECDDSNTGLSVVMATEVIPGTTRAGTIPIVSVSLVVMKQ
jgi:hypothetical protein